MPSCVFDKCCGCIDLKTGCFVIGYLNLFGAILLTVVTAIGVVGGAVAANDKDPDKHDAGIAVIVVAGILLIFMILALAFAIVLLVGLHKNKPGHLKAYLIYNLIFIIISILNFIVKCATAALPAGAVVQNILTILLTIYFLLVIRSMYFQMKNPSRGPAVYSAA